ncbi:MAG: carbamoyl-phosphate synthase large subunit [Gracilibacteraceae bacterium]|jgi:carbamoyl-phosphate synthase large subunit|nr:carbamoyl-phosphate synthase large subunit [Gracilibacteraceae bacterium]
MPRDKTIRKVLLIGSGPIVIGQAAEFDYAGTQACRALKEEGLEVVLVNSNPATIMTDRAMADHIYIEPLTADVLKRIIDKEQPDSVLSTLGGQNGLTLSMQLAKEGFLAERGIRLLGAGPETIDKAEDRQIFKDTMISIGQPVIPSIVADNAAAALEFAAEIGYPLIVRPAFTLGGSGGGMAHNERELRETAETGLRLSPIHQVLIEQSVAGWKEIEFEVMRDAAGNAVTICSMENFDPVGVHTGDSIVIAPAVTLSDKEYQMLRSAALDIINALGVEGGCNCQFALHPHSFRYAVIEVNPRVSRSSALASKATGYPIAKVAAKIALGYRLDEIKNAVTGSTYACFEPALDYVVVKLPKWPFDKFIYANRTLGTQMKATGEVMAIGTSFEEVLMKAVRGAEISLSSLRLPALAALAPEDLRAALTRCDDQRLFTVFAALAHGIAPEEIHAVTQIDPWFLHKIARLARLEETLRREGLTPALYREAKVCGYPDEALTELTGEQPPERLRASYKMVDTCGGEFAAETPYFYASYDEENEAEEVIAARRGGKTVIVFGSGPIRIGQGIEFDYASVHCVWALKKAGYDVVIVNNNPETVSTDFDTADRLYFEPLTPEDVWNIIETEKPYAAVVAFGGQTAIKLTRFLDAWGVRILGTPASAIDEAEDRARFEALLEKLDIKRPRGFTALSLDDALRAARRLGYPVLLRPSYVLGGQNMIIAFSDADVREYMEIILAHNPEKPVLIDQYLAGVEVEVDAICDGEDILIPGIMEHIERSGVHSGDSIAVYPPWNLRDDMAQAIEDTTRRLALALNTKGLVNIQYVISDGRLYVIEVNPRSSRTIPYLSKVTDIPMVELAVRAMLGEKLRDMGYGLGLHPAGIYVAVKVPVFSFEKLGNVDTHLGPEMKSTGEVLGLATTMEEALYKGLVAAGYRMKKRGGVFITVRDADKPEIAAIAKKFHELEFTLYATAGTAEVLRDAGLSVVATKKIHEAEAAGRVNFWQPLTLIESGKIDYVISTSSKGRLPERDSVQIRRKAVERSIPSLTSLDTANALADCLRSRYSAHSIELVDVNHKRAGRVRCAFTKMQSCGNDYLFFYIKEGKPPNPEGLSVRLSDRRRGVGCDGLILIGPSACPGVDAVMHMFNQDGSEGQMSGNGLCCAGKYLYDKKIVPAMTMRVATNSGVKTLELYTQNGEVRYARVEMGRPEFAPERIPALPDAFTPQGSLFPGTEPETGARPERLMGRTLQVEGRDFIVTCLSLGNPHCVVFDRERPDAADGDAGGKGKAFDLGAFDLAHWGPLFEYHAAFPRRVNTEFVHVVNGRALQMRVWERGSGETWACGTGACAAAVAAVENGFCERGADITVKLPGGDVIVRYEEDGRVFMVGSAEKAFEGEVEI